MQSNAAIEATDGGSRLTLRKPLTRGVFEELAALLSDVVDIRALWLDSAGDVALLERFPNLRRLSVVCRTSDDLRPIRKLHRLHTLKVETDQAFDVDLQNWPVLEDLSFAWSGKFENLQHASQLKVLNIWSWRDGDLKKLVDLVNLRELGIFGGTLRTLDGLEACTGLEQLRLVNMRSLSDFRAIAMLCNLRVVSIDTCRKLGNLRVFANHKQLTALDIDNVGEIESLEPLKGLPRIKSIMLREGTNIVDGNTAILAEMDVKYAFRNRKHYNMRYDHLTGKVEIR